MGLHTLCKVKHTLQGWRRGHRAKSNSKCQLVKPTEAAGRDARSRSAVSEDKGFCQLKVLTSTNTNTNMGTEGAPGGGACLLLQTQQRSAANILLINWIINTQKECMQTSTEVRSRIIFRY